MSIRLRLALAVAAVAALLTIAGAAGFAASLNAGMVATLHDTLRRSAQRIRDELTAGQLPLTGGGAHPVATGDQSVAQVLGPSGRVDYTTDTAGRLSLLTSGQLAEAHHGALFLTQSRPGLTGPHLLLAEPVTTGPGTAAVLVVGTSLDELGNAMARVVDALLFGGPLVIAIATAGGWLLAGRALRPVERLRAQAAALSARPPGERLPSPGTRDEIDRLAGTFNVLLGQLHDSLAQQREFVASAGHELRTPLAVLRAELEYAQRPGRTRDEVRAALEVLGSRLDQLSRLAADLLLLARGDEGMLALHPCTQPLEPLVTQSLLAFRTRAQRLGVALVLSADPAVTAAVDAGRFQQITDNLVANALEHGNGTSLVEVDLSAGDGQAVLAVRDRGPGLPEHFLPHAMERFTRADPARSRGKGGSGLGLAIVTMLARAHGGSAEIRNRKDGGAVALVRLPAATPTAEAAGDRTGGGTGSGADPGAGTHAGASVGAVPRRGCGADAAGSGPGGPVPDSAGGQHDPDRPARERHRPPGGGREGRPAVSGRP